MKDYSKKIKIIDRHEIILSYEIMDDNICIVYASGEQKTIPYSIDNEKRIKNQMRNQIKIADNSRDNYDEKFSLYTIITYILFCLFSITVPALYAVGIIDKLMLILVSAGYVGINIPFLYKLIDNIIINRDIEKNKLFIDNEARLTNINDHNFKKISEKTKEQIKKENEINFKNIDKIKLIELKRILENINTNDNDKVKILVK